MDYTEIRFYNDTSLNEALVAWLGENDYDMFEERVDGINAYIESSRFSEEKLKEVLTLIPQSDNISYETSLIKGSNWNKEWESNFPAVTIANRVHIRAPFHEQVESIEHEIIIEPKMSFGTGHHATTALMVELMLDTDFKGKTVLDMGTGTGILAILAERLGAQSVFAIDIDDNSVENCRENIARNKSSRITIEKGDATTVGDRKFDVILANINRNILLQDMRNYAGWLIKGGTLFLSGILTGDEQVITQAATDNDLQPVGKLTSGDWLAIKLKRN